MTRWLCLMLPWLCFISHFFAYGDGRSCHDNRNWTRDLAEVGILFRHLWCLAFIWLWLSAEVGISFLLIFVRLSLDFPWFLLWERVGDLFRVDSISLDFGCFAAIILLGSSLSYLWLRWNLVLTLLDSGLIRWWQNLALTCDMKS